MIVNQQIRLAIGARPREALGGHLLLDRPKEVVLKKRIVAQPRVAGGNSSAGPQSKVRYCRTSSPQSTWAPKFIVAAQAVVIRLKAMTAHVRSSVMSTSNGGGFNGRCGPAVIPRRDAESMRGSQP